MPASEVVNATVRSLGLLVVQLVIGFVGGYLLGLLIPGDAGLADPTQMALFTGTTSVVAPVAERLAAPLIQRLRAARSRRRPPH